MKEKTELEQIPLVIITSEEKKSNFTIKRFIGTKNPQEKTYPVQDPGAMYFTKDPEIAAREAIWWTQGHLKGEGK